MTTPLTPAQIEEALEEARAVATGKFDLGDVNRCAYALIQTHAVLVVVQEALGLLYQFKFSLAHEEDRDVVERAFNQLMTTKEETKV